MDNRLAIDGLSVELPTRKGLTGNVHPIVRSIGLQIGKGEIVCLVGESGSGKTVTALSVVRLIDYQGGRLAAGSIHLDGRNLAVLSQRDMGNLRGRHVGIIFQEPMTAFDPLFTVGDQIGEVMIRHLGLNRAQARSRTVAMLERVKIADPHLRVDQHPHEFSGGMLQRAMIAMALACGPTLLIADEPTTALDVTIQAQILDLLKDLRAENDLSILLITHDLGVAADIADRIVVMYAGAIIENGPAAEILRQPAHPYTRGLLRSVAGQGLARNERLYAIPGVIPDPSQRPSGCSFHPRCAHSTQQCRIAMPPLERLEATEVACWHPHHGVIPEYARSPQITLVPPSVRVLFDVADLRKHYRSLHAVDGVSLQIHVGETFGLVGESGSGKSTLARMLLQLEPATAGRVSFDGKDLAGLDRSALRKVRREMQMVFQDPTGSIDPRWTIGHIIGEPFAVHDRLTRAERDARVATCLEQVGLEPSWQDRYPHQLSGGQRQRVTIARAIALRPRFVLADEAVSALDVSVQAQIINLLQDLKAQLGLTYLFIGHGLNLVRHVSDRIGVMYLGRLVEVGPADAVFDHPAHPYTRALVAAVPSLDPARRRGSIRLEQEVQAPVQATRGCRFHPRCPAAISLCREADPPLVALDAQRFVACHFPL